jgi:hypothetical protein
MKIAKELAIYPNEREYNAVAAVAAILEEIRYDSNIADFPDVQALIEDTIDNTNALLDCFKLDEVLQTDSIDETRCDVYSTDVIFDELDEEAEEEEGN